MVTCSEMPCSSTLSTGMVVAGIGILAAVSAGSFGVYNIWMDRSITMLKVFGEKCPTSSYGSGWYATDACMALGMSILDYDIASKVSYAFFGFSAAVCTYILWNTRPVKQLNAGEKLPLVQTVPFPINSQVSHQEG